MIKLNFENFVLWLFLEFVEIILVFKSVVRVKDFDVFVCVNCLVWGVFKLNIMWYRDGVVMLIRIIINGDEVVVELNLDCLCFFG